MWRGHYVGRMLDADKGELNGLHAKMNTAVDGMSGRSRRQLAEGWQMCIRAAIPAKSV